MFPRSPTWCRPIWWRDERPQDLSGVVRPGENAHTFPSSETRIAQRIVLARAGSAIDGIDRSVRCADRQDFFRVGLARSSLLPREFYDLLNMRVKRNQGERSVDWMLLPLKRYADFQGRSRRLEYWMFALFIFLVAIAWGIVFAILGGLSGYENGTGIGTLAMAWIFVAAVAYLAILIPSIAVQVRRFHDRDMSGWFVLLNFIPYIGGLVVFVFMVLPGTVGENRFGPDPKDPHGVDAVAEVFS